MFEWHLNDGMGFEWWNDIWMMEWHSSDVIIVTQRVILLPRPPLCRVKVYIRSSHFNDGMTYEWMNDIQMIEWHLNDWMTFEWLNGIWMMEWHLNDGMTFEWWNDILMLEWHSNDGIIVTQRGVILPSTPLCRVKVYICYFCTHILNIWMSWKLWNDF